MSKNRLNLFYVLAFAPLMLNQYFGYIAYSNFFPPLIPLYGFLLLLIKKDKLSAFTEGNRVHKTIGLSLILASFFVYYAIAFFYPHAQFYGVANYTVYIVGLFLVFFQVSALKESISVLFLLVGATSIGFVGKWMESYMESWVPYFVPIMAFILRLLNIPAKLVNPTTFILKTQGGQSLPIAIAAGCIGIYSFLIFAFIIVVTMMEDPSNVRTKVLWSIAGIIGTFFVNIVRVSLIVVVIYYFGFERWGEIHTPIGYVLFILWLIFFFLIFSKREVILGKLKRIYSKIYRSVNHAGSS